MGSVQEWSTQGPVQVAATQLLINSCETLQDQWKELLFHWKKNLFSVNGVFFEVRKIASVGQCSPKVFAIEGHSCAYFLV